MSWRITGELHEGHAMGWLAWDDGKLTGSPEALDMVQLLTLDGVVPLTPTGPFLDADMSNSVAAYITALHVIRDPEITGDIPPLNVPKLPEGAIG